MTKVKVAGFGVSLVASDAVLRYLSSPSCERQRWFARNWVDRATQAREQSKIVRAQNRQCSLPRR